MVYLGMEMSRGSMAVWGVGMEFHSIFYMVELEIMRLQ